MENVRKREMIGFLEIIGAFTLAGSSIVVGKMLSLRVPVFLTGFLSLFFALVLLIPFQLKRVHELKGIKVREFLLMFMQALCGIVLVRMLTLLGLRYTSALNAGIINSTTPAVMTFFSVILFKEKLKANNYAGLFFSVSGMVIININSTAGGPASFLGNILIFGAVIGEVFMTLFRKMTREKISSLTNTTVLFSLSLLIFLPFAVKELKSYPLTSLEQVDWMAILFYGLFGSAAAYILWGDGVLKVSASKAGVGTTMIPLSVMLLSVTVLGEQFAFFHGLGAFFCICGMIFFRAGEREKKLGYLKQGI